MRLVSASPHKSILTRSRPEVSEYDDLQNELWLGVKVVSLPSFTANYELDPETGVWLLRDLDRSSPPPSRAGPRIGLATRTGLAYGLVLFLLMCTGISAVTALAILSGVDVMMSRGLLPNVRGPWCTGGPGTDLMV